MKNYLFAFVFFIVVAILFFSVMGCNPNTSEEGGETDLPAKESKVKVLNFNVIGEYPHDTASFTEGLEFFNGKLYESGGLEKESLLQFGDAKSGKLDKKNRNFSDSIFAEGITILNNKLYQLTYKNNEVFVYDVKDITKVIQKFKWPYQGWGMTNNGTDLMITTGGTELYFVDPATFKVKSTIRIHNEAGAVDNVNEIEYVDGFIYGNVFAESEIYPSTTILKINATNGEIVGTIDCSKLQAPQDKLTGRPDVFNGIAYNKETKTFFVTGKRWNKMYEFSLN
jgi:glutaminyl-peptide cyclotransferase